MNMESKSELQISLEQPSVLPGEKANARVNKDLNTSTYPLNALRRDGSSQNGRFPLALDSGYFQIDERGLEDLLDFILRLSAEVNFGTPVAPPDQTPDWKPFFQNDPSVVLAQVLRYPLGQWKAQAEATISDVRQSIQAIRAANLLDADAKAQLIAAIDLLLVGNDQLPSPIAALHDWVARLGNALEFQIDPQNTEKGAVKRHADDLEALKGSLSPTVWQVNALSETLDKLQATMSRVVAAVSQAISGLQLRSRAQFERSLRDYPRHSPHLGLLIAFLQIYRHAQGRLNEILPAHLDFYYRNVLRFAPKTAQPDSVHLLASLSAHTPHLRLPAGTTFVAKDKRSYLTTEDWAFGQGQIGSLLALQNRQGLTALTQGEAGEGSANWPAHDGLRQAAAATVGWAFSSHVLRMEAGRRRVQVGIGLVLNGYTERQLASLRNENIVDQLGMTVSISTVEGWKQVAINDARLLAPGAAATRDHFLPKRSNDSEMLFFELVMPPEFPAILGYDAAVHGPGWDTADPLLKFERSIDSAQAGYYALLSKAIVIDWHIAVAVVNQQPSMENDQSSLDGSKTFAPFGTLPAVNSRWTINIQEAASKRNLREFSLNWFWGQLSVAEIPGYFEGYTSNLGRKAGDNTPRLLNANEFVTHLELYQGTRLVSDLGPRAVYEGTSTRKRRIRFGGSSVDNQDPPAFVPVFEKTSTSAPLAGPRDGYNLQFTLTGPPIAFGHQHYALAYANASKLMEQKQIVAANHPGWTPDWSEVQYPNPPITPTITEIRLSYLASDGSTDVEKFGAVKFYHVSAFGFAAVAERTALSLFPRYEAGAALYIGCVDAVYPSSLNLLIQMDSGSGDPEQPLPSVSWSYLQGDDWRAFLPSEIPSDGTLGLRQSGIVRFNLPAKADLVHRLLPSGFVWLRLQALGSPEALDRIAGLHAQAFAVTLQPGVGAAIEGALQPESLSKPANYVAGLREVRQPYASFGGAIAATLPQFQAQVAERLRHKNRSIALLDYEQIVLERFPSVYKVKCINHAAPKGGLKNGVILQHDHELSPGHLTVVCIPKTPNLLAANPLQPRFGRDVLGAIQDSLQAEVPPFVTVHAVNATYVELQLSGQVVFKPGVDAGIGMDLLQVAIARYLCPWAFEEGEEIHFDGRVHRSQLLNLIEQQAYVDVVANFKMAAAGYGNDEELIEATTSRMVLVPAQVQGLVSVALEDLDYEGSLVYGGIGFWRIHQDFEVNGK